MIGDVLVGMSSAVVVTLQPIVALSNTKAKYRGAGMATYEIAWLCKLLLDLGHDVPRIVTLYRDNMSNIQTIQYFTQGQNT